MNRDFARYQPLPLPDLSHRERESRPPTQTKAEAIGPSLVSSIDVIASGNTPKANQVFEQRCVLSPLPEGEGQGEGKETVTAPTIRPINSLRA